MVVAILLASTGTVFNLVPRYGESVRHPTAFYADPDQFNYQRLQMLYFVPMDNCSEPIDPTTANCYQTLHDWQQVNGTFWLQCQNNASLNSWRAPGTTLFMDTVTSRANGTFCIANLNGDRLKGVHQCTVTGLPSCVVPYGSHSATFWTYALLRLMQSAGINAGRVSKSNHWTLTGPAREMKIFRDITEKAIFSTRNAAQTQERPAFLPKHQIFCFFSRQGSADDLY